MLQLVALNLMGTCSLNELESVALDEFATTSRQLGVVINSSIRARSVFVCCCFQIAIIVAK